MWKLSCYMTSKSQSCLTSTRTKVFLFTRFVCFFIFLLKRALSTMKGKCESHFRDLALCPLVCQASISDHEVAWGDFKWLLLLDAINFELQNTQWQLEPLFLRLQSMLPNIDENESQFTKPIASSACEILHCVFSLTTYRSLWKMFLNFWYFGLLS